MIPIPFDYMVLRVIWWGLLGVLLIGLAVMDGFDMGVAFLNPILGRSAGSFSTLSVPSGTAIRSGSSPAAERYSPHGRRFTLLHSAASMSRCSWS